jgi:hypothetical protein
MFSQFIKVLCDAKHAPRRVLPHKFYMNHPNFKEKCAEEFTKRWEEEKKAPNFDPKTRLHFQCSVAKEVFDREPEDVREMIVSQVKEDYEEKFEAYKELVNGDKIALEGVEDFGEMSQQMYEFRQ